MVLKLVCLPIRAARCGVRLGFALGLAAGMTAAAGVCALAVAANRRKSSGG
jgi:hypothetical protein